MSAADTPRRGKFLGTVALACATMVVAGPASAADSNPETAEPSLAKQTAAAQALFEEARTLLAAERYEEACPKLAESLRLDAGAGTGINLGHCYEKTGQIASAWAAFRDAAEAARQAGRLDWAARADGRAELLKQKLSTIVLAVPPANVLDGMEIRRDGEIIVSSSWGVAIPVNPGKHHIEVTAPARPTWVKELDVPIAWHFYIEVPMLADVAQMQTSPSALVSPPAIKPYARAVQVSSSQRIAGIVISGLGFGSVGAGIAVGVWAALANREVEDGCPNRGPCHDQRLSRLSHDAKNAGNAATGAFVAGGVLSALGGVLFFAAPRRSKPTTASLVVRPMQRALGLVCDGAF